MSAAFEVVSEERVEYIYSQAGADNSRAYAEHVSIVVLSCHLCRIGVGAERRSYAAVLICAHRHTDTGSAHKYTERGLKICLYVLAHSISEDGVVA